MTLDVDKFRKVWRLVEDGSTEGERAAAFTAAKRIAESAGMTPGEARQHVFNLDNPPPPVWRPFEAFDDQMEKKEPGWKARRAAERAAQLREREEARRRVIAEWGSEEAILARSKEEETLSASVEHLKAWSYWTDNDGRRHMYVDDIAGWGRLGGRSSIPASVEEAVSGAYPLPADLVGAWAEWSMWERLKEARHALQPDEEYAMDLWTEARIYLLEDLLHTLPVRTSAPWEDIEVTLRWREVLNDKGWDTSFEHSARFAKRMRVSFEIVRAISEGVQNEHSPPAPPPRRTATERRRDVVDLLARQPALTDREIARRCGCSPTTVGSLRKKAAADAPLFEKRVG